MLRHISALWLASLKQPKGLYAGVNCAFACCLFRKRLHSVIVDNETDTGAPSDRINTHFTRNIQIHVQAATVVVVEGLSAQTHAYHDGRYILHGA
jgi:hypothetical protein